MTQPRPFRTGVNWMPDRGKLYRFGRDGVTVIRPWPHPQAWRKNGSGRWYGHIPEVQLGVVDREAWYWPHRFEVEAWATVPAEVRALVLGSAMAGHQWQALCLAARAPQARPLMAEFPLLAATLASVNWLRSLQGRSRLTHPWRAARTHGGRARGWRGWLDLAGWLGLPTERAFLRLLRRVAHPRRGLWSVPAVHQLAEAWAHPKARKLLLHLPGPTILQASLLSRACQDEAVMGALRYRLLADPTRPTERAAIVETVRSLVTLRGRVPDPPSVPPLETLGQVERARDAVLARIPGARPRPLESLPEPPLEGTEHIRPLDSVAALAAEGREMDHCIGTIGWAMLAHQRAGYGYAIRVPVDGAVHRGTAWIAPAPDRPGAFKLEQLQGPGNSQPHPAVVRAVAAWLNDHALAQLLLESPAAHLRWRAQGPLGAYPDDDIPF